MQTGDAYNLFGRLRFLLNASLTIIRTTMKHSISLMMLIAGVSAAVLSGANAYAATTASSTRTDAQSARDSSASESTSNNSGLATEDASRASEQQLLGLPRVPKDTNLSAPDDGSAAVTRVALRRSATSSASASTKHGDVFANPFPASIYPADSSGTVYQSPW
ncbi:MULTISPECIES: hypothetical protein [unclassified Paraburkholderia]|uniref:hypothetical protein n=1 Tax=unclassified Paraburkholderia TaxID=2615204 RepID=UPI002AB2B788|nr:MULTISPECIES: hypothetical protein [unclassified Paraburkholderia]